MIDVREGCRVSPVGIEIGGFPVGVVCSPSSFFFRDLVSLPVMAVVAGFVPCLVFLLGVVGAGFDVGAVCVKMLLVTALVALAVVFPFVDIGAVVAEAIFVVESLGYFLGEPVDFSFAGDGASDDGLLDGDVKSLGIHDVVVRVGY